MPLRIGVAARLAHNVFRQIEAPLADLPVFLCPALAFSASRIQSYQRRSIHSLAEHTNTPAQNDSSVQQSTKEIRAVALVKRLPQQCSGCGALSQTVDKDQPGYFDLVKQRKSVKRYLTGSPDHTKSKEDVIFEQAIAQAMEKDPKYAELLGGHTMPSNVGSIEAPVCERCHYLKNESIAVPIHHPSMQSIQDTISESPYKYNHIYHIIDAVDFPMSLIPGIYKTLSLTPQRSLNRRSKTGRFYHGKKTDISFIITRSDLLAPTKLQVDAMMPYLRAVLRDSLGRAGTDVRLGNMRCVSAKQSWWTKELKGDIWNRGGGGWMVGRVNVGKSQLFHEVFPKGRRGRVEGGTLVEFPTTLESQEHDNADKDPELPLIENPEDQVLSSAPELSGTNLEPTVDAECPPPAVEDDPLDNGTLNTSSLLPPAQIETDYPPMPLVSSLPGTTASPIRVPFGNGKGELIDLPGLARGDLEQHVQPEHRSSLILRSRIRPEQQVLKPGQSLLLGGLVRITPTTPGVIFLAYSFMPFHSHLTSTQKAIEFQEGTRTSEEIGNIAVPGIGEKMESAGTFHLKWDVTKQRTRPITARGAAGIRVEQLPFRVMSADVLIEGCGWVELTAQIRKRPGEMWDDPAELEGRREGIDPQWPSVEVFTPGGQYIAIRQPLNAWLNFVAKPSEKRAKSRPMRSMKGMAKLARQRAREKAKVNL